MRSAHGIALAALGTLALAGCTYTENVGLDIDPRSATCFVQDSTAILQIPLSADPTVGFDPNVLRVEFDRPVNIALSGIGVVERETPFTASVPMPAAVLETLAASRDDTMLHAEVPHSEVRTLIVLLEAISNDTSGRFESLRVFWGGGEPIYWQPLDLAVTVDEDCTTN